MRIDPRTGARRSSSPSASVLGEYDLRWWTDALLPICDPWIATAEGNPDAAFWQSIHRPLATYGGHLITGWLPRLFPYVGGARGVWRRFARSSRRTTARADVRPAKVERRRSSPLTSDIA